MLIIAFLLGCSTGGNPVQPPDRPVREYVTDGTGEGRSLWAYVNIEYDRASGEFIVTEKRSIEVHVNVKPFILPPNCYDCIGITLLSANPYTQTYNFRIKLKNPTVLTAYDVRGIVILDPAKNHQLLNADGYTTLWDDGPAPATNPFRMYATSQPNHQFGSMQVHKVDYEMLVPTGNFSIDYAVDASYPGNCKEPYEIVVPDEPPKFDPYGAQAVNIDFTVNDWQSDVEQVWVEASSMGYSDLIPAAYIGPGQYRATFSNIYQVGVGIYSLRVDAKSVGSNLWMYHFFTAEVVEIEPDRLPAVLEEMTKTKATLKYSGDDLNWFVPDMIEEWQTQWSTRLSYYDDNHRNILKYPEWAENVTDELHDNYNSFENLIIEAAAVLDAPQSPSGFSFAPGPTPLLQALIELHTTIGDPLSSGEQSTISADAADVPNEVQVMAAKILHAMSQAYGYRNTAISGYDAAMKDILWNSAANPLVGGDIFFGLLWEMCDYNYSKQYQAATWIAAALDDIRPAANSFTPSGDFDFQWETPIGLVVIDGTGAASYSGNEFCLIFDCDGDDTYGSNVAANSSWENAFSVCVDLRGDDTYNIGSTKKAFGCGHHGTAILWDVHGNDDYNGMEQCEGYGMFGVGILCDSEGTETYNIERIGQGGAAYGIGILIDESGDDHYDTYTYSQGFGYVKGFGALIDMDGNDIYQANVTDIKYPSAQDPAHNFSMSQGAGFGFRADAAWIYLSGGVGVLIDGGGTDYYETDIMGTAFAYWFSSGIIADYGTGNDEYHGYWYNVAATAHYGSSIIFEYGGDDYYECIASVGVGGAHDFSNSFLLDYNGNDIYDGSHYTIGGGNECGTGVCIDWNGNDTYNVESEPSLGGGNYSTGRSRDSWGVFIDMGGTDTYNDTNSTLPQNDALWSKGQTGAGGDFISGDVIWQD